VRAQVERHWNPDAVALGARNFTILIHVVMKSDGTIIKAELVDKSLADPEYHYLALSARNAVLLSSPISLPVGRYEKIIDVTLNLNPRDAMR
jgi:hypothetical protein